MKAKIIQTTPNKPQKRTKMLATKAENHDTTVSHSSTCILDTFSLKDRYYLQKLIKIILNSPAR
jgi:hypothetical protein